MTDSDSVHILCAGLNHHTAAIDIRERFAFPKAELGPAMQAVCRIPGVTEAVIINTCNRMEVYAVTQAGPHDPGAIAETIIDWLHERFACPQRYDSHFFTLCGDEAVRHLLCVNSGLDSLVLGEPQIGGQVKQVHRLSSSVEHPDDTRHPDATVMGSVLDRLFQCAFRCSKQIRTDTDLSRHPVTVPYATLALAQQIFADLTESTLLLLGAGEMIELCARHFAGHPVSRILIVNRDPDRARELAGLIDDRLPVTAHGFDELAQVLPGADILISSTSSHQPLISRAMVAEALKQRRHKPMLMVDIAVPRDISSEVNELGDVYLYAIDDLTMVLEDNRRQRAEAARAAEKIVAEHTEQFRRWLNLRKAGKQLQRFREHAHRQEQRLLQRAMQQLDKGDDPHQVLATFSHQLVQKLLHTGTLKLRSAAETGDRALLDELQDLFKLEAGRDSRQTGAGEQEDESGGRDQAIGDP